jgi:hypothetical protein
MSVAILEGNNLKNIYVGSLNLTQTPTVDNTNTNYLVRNVSGIIELNTTILPGPSGPQGAIGPSGATGATGIANVTSGATGDLVSYTTSSSLGDSGILASNVALLNASNSFTGSKNQLKLLYGNNSSTPTVVLGPGSDTSSSSYSIVGTDICGQISITTGNTPTYPAIVATITMNTASTHAPLPVISGANLGTVQLVSQTTGVFAISASNNSWTINSYSAPLAGNTTYIWNYIVGSY